MKTRGFVPGLLLAALVLAAMSLPGCTHLTAGSLKSSIVINAPVEEVFAWVANPENHGKRLPDQKITDVHGSGLGAGYHFYVKAKYGVFQGDQVVVGYIPNQLWVEEVALGLNGTGVYTWIFLAQGDQTQIVKVANSDFEMPFLARLLSKKKITDMAQTEQDRELQRVKAEVEKK
jgi:hypothetical protein